MEIYNDDLVADKEQLIENIKTVERYLNEPANEEELNDIINFIKKGRVFLAYKVGDELHFAPSKFVGYRDNTIEVHKEEDADGWRDGRETTQKISKLLGRKESPNDDLEKQYIAYCAKLGFKHSKNHRKYWLLDEDFTDKIYLEGATRIEVHKRRERNREVVLRAKELFKQAHEGRLYCEVCSFDFEKVYGELGKDFIEAHHIAEFSKTIDEHEIRPEDFAMVCSNCHSVLHRAEVCVEELRERIKV